MNLKDRGIREHADQAVDLTESIRRARVADLNAEAAARAELEARYGTVLNTDELRLEFDVIGFMAPFVVAKCRRTGKKGSLEFQHSPRFYFNWQEDR
jgi:hypothetical protein